MDLSIQQLEAILTAFPTTTNDQQIQETNRILNQWRDSFDSFTASIEIIQTSSNIQLILFSLFTIENHFEKNLALITKNYFEMIFICCLEKVHICEAAPPVLKSNLLHCCAAATYYNPPLLNHTNLFINDELVYFFDFLLLKIREHSDKLEVSPILDNIQPLAIINVLEQGLLSPSWLSLHKSLIMYVNQVSVLAPFLPQLQMATTNETLIPGLLDLFDTIMQKPYDSFEGYEKDIIYVKDFITIMVNYANSALLDPSESKIAYASVIWNNIIDLTFDFYGSEIVGVDFTNQIFAKFIEDLQIILNLKMEEFYALLYVYCCCLGYHSEKTNPQFMTPYIVSGLDLMISFIDGSPATMCCPNMDNCMSTLMNSLVPDSKTYVESVDQYYSKLLTQYFARKIDKITDGVVYALSFAPERIRQLFVSHVGIKIFEKNPPPLTSIYFISRCCQFTPEIHQMQINLTFALFEYAPPYEIGEALISLTESYASSFVEQAETYIPPILKVLENVNNEIASNLFIVMFNIFSCIANNAVQMKPLFETVGACFINRFPNQISNFDMLLSFNNFVVPIIERSKNDKLTMTPYYSTLFDHIANILSPLWGITKEAVQEELCLTAEAVLKHNWIINKQPIFNWIENILNLAPIPLHLRVLQHLLEFLPSQQINIFLSKATTFSNNMLNEEIILFSVMFEANPALLFTQIPLDYIIYPLQGPSPVTLERELNLLGMIVKSDIQLPVDFAEKLAQVVAIRVFKNPGLSETRGKFLAFILLRMIGKKYGIMENTLQYILQALPIQNHQTEIFANNYLGDTPDELKNGFKALISAFG